LVLLHSLAKAKAMAMAKAKATAKAKAKAKAWSDVVRDALQLSAERPPITPRPFPLGMSDK
jgi:hypothetical protein